MHRDIAKFCRACLDCQKSKISRHNHVAPAQFVALDGRFKHVYMDIVGPLPVSNGYKYCLTMIDRFSRWHHIEASTVCCAFVDQWISRYGAPETLTTDQGSQFESQIFTALLRLTGCHRIRTTAYHPAANGMIERWHHLLKAAIMCPADPNWSRSLSTILPCLRSNVMDIGSSPAEFVYGTTLRIRREFVLPDDFTPNPHFFVEELRKHMQSTKPVPVGHNCKKRECLHKDLKSCSHVFLRVGTRKKSLERPYTGPHKIIKRTSDRVFEVEVNSLPRHVSVENILLPLLQPYKSRRRHPKRN